MSGCKWHLVNLEAHFYTFLNKKVLGLTLLKVHRFYSLTRPGNTPITYSAYFPMIARKDTRHVSYYSHYFDKTRKYSNHRKQPIPSYDNKKRFKTTSHTTHFLTRPGNTPITDYSLYLHMTTR